MKTRLSRQQLLAVGLASFGLVFGLAAYMILVAPQKSKAVALAGAVDAAQTSLSVAQHAPRHVRPKPVAVEAADLFRLTKAMPDSTDVPGILRALTRLAKASSVELISLQPSPDAPTPMGYSTVPISVSVHGRFANVSNFLHRLRDSAVVTHKHLKVTGRLFVTNQISLTSADGLAVDATIALNAFVYGEAPVAGSTSTETTTTTTTASTG